MLSLLTAITCTLWCFIFKLAGTYFHAVGKFRKKWVESVISPTGVEMLRAIKERVDPQNIFGVQNLIPNSS